MKTLEDNFTDWESDAFGFGYGSGEPHTIPALKEFFALCAGERGNYQYEVLEKGLTPAAAWMMLNLMGHQRMIEYGTSPRYGWLTPEGSALKSFVDSKTTEELLTLTQRDEEYISCSRNSCNCGPNGYQSGVLCANPFWFSK